MANKCKECKKWEPFSGDTHLERQQGVCSNPVMAWDATEWAADGKGLALKEMYKDNNVFLQDASEYYASMFTTEDFYCADFIKNRKRQHANQYKRVRRGTICSNRG